MLLSLVWRGLMSGDGAGPQPPTIACANGADDEAGPLFSSSSRRSFTCSVLRQELRSFLLEKFAGNLEPGSAKDIGGDEGDVKVGVDLAEHLVAVF